MHNAFTSVRPRGAEAPAKAPRKTNHSRAPVEGNVHMALDRNGRRTVSLERRTTADHHRKPRAVGGIAG